MNKIKEKRIELGISQSKLSKLLNIPKRTIESWDSTKDKRYPQPWIEKLVLEKMDSINRKKSGLKMLDEIQECKVLFTNKEASNLAKLAIKYQLEYYKKTNEYYSYTPEILEKTLKKISPKNMGKGPLTIDEIMQKVEDLSVL